MGPHDHDESDERSGTGGPAGSPPHADAGADDHGPTAGPQVVETNDPVIAAGPAHHSDWKRNPDRTMVIETSRIHESDAASTPDLLMVPVEYDRPPQAHGRPDAGGRAEDANGGGPGTGPGRGHDEGESGDRGREAPAHPARGHSTARSLFFSGLVALVCGAAGAWGYSHFFGPGKSDDRKSSSKDSDSSASKSSDPSSSSSKKAPDSKSGGGSGSEAGAGGKDVPHFARSDEADAASLQNEHLSERVDRLAERVDKLSQPRDWTPPDIRGLQIKVDQMGRAVEGVGDLSARFRGLEDRLDDLSRQLKSMHAKPSAPGGGVGGATGPAPPPSPAAGAPAAPPPVESAVRAARSTTLTSADGRDARHVAPAPRASSRE